MSEKTIEEKVKDIIVEQLGVNPEQVTREASFIEDLGADSLDTVELVMAFEEEFSIEVPDEDAEKLQKVGDVIRTTSKASRTSRRPKRLFYESTLALRGGVLFVFAAKGQVIPLIWRCVSANLRMAILPR